MALLEYTELAESARLRPGSGKTKDGMRGGSRVPRFYAGESELGQHPPGGKGAAAPLVVTWKVVICISRIPSTHSSWWRRAQVLGILL